MRCASCDEPIYRLDEPCPHCQFKGDPALVEELAHVNWTLGEIANWRTLSAADRHKITLAYTARQHELEIKLGLRLPLFSDEEARKAWPELFRREALLQKMAEWPQAGFITPAAASAIADAASLQVDDLLAITISRPMPSGAIGSGSNRRPTGCTRPLARNAGPTCRWSWLNWRHSLPMCE